MIKVLAVTTGEVMVKILYGFYNAEIGQLVLGKTGAGLCWVGFMVDGYKGNGLERMFAHFKDAEFVHDDAAVQILGAKIINAWKAGTESAFEYDLRGTAFQKKVWKALLDIRKGDKKSYQDIANDIGSPKAVRAVGTAVGSNPVSLLVPCHRVVQKSGALGNYGWGVDLKRELLSREL